MKTSLVFHEKKAGSLGWLPTFLKVKNNIRPLFQQNENQV
jgi:hypothetical protein